MQVFGNNLHIRPAICFTGRAFNQKFIQAYMGFFSSVNKHNLFFRIIVIAIKYPTTL